VHSESAAPSAVTASALLAELASSLGGPAEARWVLAAAGGLAAHALPGVESLCSAEVAASARAMARRCAGGEPLQYVLGTWAFRSLEVMVDPRVLIPRPETEVVAGLALELVSGRRSGGHVTAVDLGTGSGVIALSLAAEGPAGLEVWAGDVSTPALEVARANLDVLAQPDPAAGARVRLVAGSWFEALPRRLAGTVDVVVSNPPYVSEGEWEGLEPVVRDHEPKLALVPGAAGTEALAHLVEQAPLWLCPGGALVLELAPHQADVMMAVAVERGFHPVSVRQDLAGRRRALVARWPGP